MIVDLNHVSPPGRKDVYEINEARGNGNLKPLVFSHIGLRRNCPNEIKTPEDWEVRKIRDSNGVIGIIFMNYWIRGFEGEPDYGIDSIVKTVVDIAKICSETEDESNLNSLNFDHIAIGTDMDGFTQPIDDLYDSSQMIKLTQALLDRGLSSNNIQKILGINAMRVLREGWG
jgi:membrane dipeptidase